MPAIVLAGDEEFLISRKVKSLKEKLVDPTWASFNFAQISNPDLKKVIEAAATLPFGPGNRMVLLDDCALFTKKKGAADDAPKDKSAAKLIDDFGQALSSIAPNTYLVFACIANFDKSLKTSKVAEKHVTLESYEKMKHYGGDPKDYVVTFCNAESMRWGATIDNDAISYLAECAVEDSKLNLRQIAKEIEKAATYILPAKRIKGEHAMLLSPHYSNVFAMMEHWALKRPDLVMESLSELQTRLVPAPMTMAAMQTVLSKWILYKSEIDKAGANRGGGRDVGKHNVNLKDLASRISPHQAYMVEKDLQRIKAVPLAYLVRKKQELTNLEMLVKTGDMPDTHVLEAFFTR